MSKTKRKEIDYHKLSRKMKKELEVKQDTTRKEPDPIQMARVASAVKAWRL